MGDAGVLLNRYKALGQDEWLKSQGIVPPGHVDAPLTAGPIFWKLLERHVQTVSWRIFIVAARADGGLSPQTQYIPFDYQTTTSAISYHWTD